MSVRAPRHYKTRRDPRDNDFLTQYRFTRETMVWMSDYFLGEDGERRGGAVTNFQKMRIFCRYMADPGFQSGVAEDIGVDQSTVSRHIVTVMDAILCKKEEWIHFPTSEQEIQNAKHLWLESKMFPSTVGAIDCTHVPIEKPAGVFGDEFVNRKGYASINVQATCNGKWEFTSIDVSWPGSVHDSRVLRNSSLFHHLQSTQASSILLGDEGYPLHPFLMTPYKTPTSNREKLFNKVHSKERVVIEQAFGQLKRRFPMLRYGIRLALKSVPAAIVSCAVLHNIAKRFNEPLPFDDEQTVDVAQHVAQDIEIDDDSQGSSRRNEIANVLFTNFQ